MSEPTNDRVMSEAEFSQFKKKITEQIAALVAGMDFQRGMLAVSALISLLASELPPELVQTFMDRARALALAATPQQLAGKGG